MYSFKNDYSEGAHPNILNALLADNMRQMTGYGEDEKSLEATSLIRQHIGNPDAAVHLISGGTQTNLIFISAVLRPHEAVIAVDSGHINVHETGAIEATGHKVCAIAGDNGKLTPQLIDKVVTEHCDEHMVKPKMVFIADATEVGTLYTKAELIAISNYCKSHNLYLYLDGARLASALMANGNDLTMAELSSLVDAFYIGGTKSGALLGEALVINNPILQEDFRYLIKQRGAMLAKGRLLGTQFVELFKNNLFYDLAAHANQMAEVLTHEMSQLGIKFLTNSTTNQIFPILDNQVIAKLSTNYYYTPWSTYSDTESCIRLVTSWATLPTAVGKFIVDLKKAL